MRILVSGASIAGPVLAYWLTRFGHEVTVVERAPELRKTGGGHAVDVFGPAMEICERMGAVPAITERSTGTTRLTVHREGARRPATIDLAKLFGAVTDRHIEIMRDDLSEIFADLTRADVEYVFGDSITSIADDGAVEFDSGAPRRFDLVIGADGLHSTVRNLVFGPESMFSTFLGAYLGVVSVPDSLRRDGEYIEHLGVGRTAGVYSARHLDDARAVFLFRSRDRLDYHYRDVPRQKQLLRGAFTGMHPEVDGWLSELDRTPAFYFDSITQLRMARWSRGRVTLVGDAGFCPGPAVGGSTSLAIVGAYVLAGELAVADGDHERAFAAYERVMTPLVLGSRSFARDTAKKQLPTTRFGTWMLVRSLQMISALPAGLGRYLAQRNTKGLRLYDSLPLGDYATPGTPRPDGRA